MLILQPRSLLGYLVQTQIKFNFISLLQLPLVVCKHDMLEIPHHSMTAHNCCAVPASPQHVRLKHLGVVTAGGRKEKFCERRLFGGALYLKLCSAENMILLEQEHWWDSGEHPA